jgi:alpha-L-fucosidase
MGNESGVAGETNWSTMNIEGFGPGHDAPASKILNTGEEGGKAWVPAETDVSIRPGWFYSASTDNRVKSLARMVDIYYTSVGRNSNLLLNVPPDRRGLIHKNDSARLMELRRIIDESFAVNLAKDAKFTASYTRGQSPKYAAKNLANKRYDSYWTTDDDQLSASIEIDFEREQTFNRLTLQEYIPLGQRVKTFSVEYWDGNAWQLIDRQTTIGYKRILRFQSVTARKMRVNIEKSLACPVLNTIAVFNAPELLSPVAIMRNKNGMVSINCESKDPVIYYTIDGAEPTVNSQKYSKPFALPDGGTVMAKAFINNNTQSSETVSEDFDIAPTKWSVVSPEGRGFERAIDGNPYSSCVLPENNSAIVIDLGEKINLKGFTYHPVAGSSGNILTYNFYTGMNGKRWKKQMNNAGFDNIQNNPVPQFVRFKKPINARFIKLEAIRTVKPEKRAVIGEIGIISRQ